MLIHIAGFSARLSAATAAGTMYPTRLPFWYEGWQCLRTCLATRQVALPTPRRAAAKGTSKAPLSHFSRDTGTGYPCSTTEVVGSPHDLFSRSVRLHYEATCHAIAISAIRPESLAACPETQPRRYAHLADWLHHAIRWRGHWPRHQNSPVLLLSRDKPLLTGDIPPCLTDLWGAFSTLA